MFRRKHQTATAAALTAVTGWEWLTLDQLLIAQLAFWCDQHPHVTVHHGCQYWQAVIRQADGAERVIVHHELSTLLDALEQLAP